MEANYDYITKTVVLKFDTAQKPKFEEKRGKEKYILFGEKNDYPNYLMGLFNESPKHGAIVKGKTNYIYGKGFEGVPNKANNYGQSWNSVMKMSISDDELYGGYYLQIVYNVLGKIASVFNLAFAKVRVSKDGSTFFVKNDWNDNREEARVYPAFNPTEIGRKTQVLFVKQYNPESDVYPLPNYYQGLNYIESDIQVSRHILGNAKQGFVGSTLINLNNGEPAEEQKGEVEKGLKKKFTGSEGDRVVLMFNKSKETSAEILPLGQTMLTKEDFTNVNNLIQQEVFAAHQITSPMLFGIKSEGQLGGRSEIRDAYQIFCNTYVNERQQAHEEVFNRLINLSGIEGEYKIIPVEPLGFEFSEAIMAANLSRDEIREMMGKDPDGLSNGTAGVVQAAAANDSIKNLTGRQHQNVMRIVRQFSNGKLTKEQASLMLKNGFGFTDEDVNTFLGVDSDPLTEEEVKMFAQDNDDELYNAFAEGGESMEDYEVLSSKPAREMQYFAETKKISTLQNDILNLIAKDKKITAENIAQVLKQDVKVINAAIKSLEDSGILKINIQRGESEITKPLKEITKEPSTITEVLVRYTYNWRSEVPTNQRNTPAHPSRPFCVKMMGLNKMFSRADIERISERLGYDVFARVGGYWNDNGVVQTHCRHEWFAVTVIKKTKK